VRQGKAGELGFGLLGYAGVRQARRVKFLLVGVRCVLARQARSVVLCSVVVVLG
jgi:hypothetical protein